MKNYFYAITLGLMLSGLIVFGFPTDAIAMSDLGRLSMMESVPNHFDIESVERIAYQAVDIGRLS